MSKKTHEPVIITLSSPVTYVLKSENGEREETIETLKMRPPKAGDLLVMQDYLGNNQKMSATFALVAHLCGVPQRVIDKLEIDDFAQVAKELANFMPSGLAIGEML